MQNAQVNKVQGKHQEIAGSAQRNQAERFHLFGAFKADSF
jgi:hypothetical protein